MAFVTVAENRQKWDFAGVEKTDVGKLRDANNNKNSNLQKTHKEIGWDFDSLQKYDYYTVLEELFIH